MENVGPACNDSHNRRTSRRVKTYRGCTPGVRETHHRERRYNSSRVEDGCRRVFFFSSVSQQEAVRAATEHPKRNQASVFHLVKHNATLFPGFSTRKTCGDCGVGGVGEGDPLPGVTNNHATIWRGGARTCTSSPPQPPPPKQYSSTASARRVSCHRVSQDRDVPQY